MFVENDRGTWRAWILSGATGPNVEATDSFAGRRMEVKVTLEADGHQDDDPAGREHSGAGSGFRFTDTATRDGLPGLDFDGGTLNLNANKRDCSATLYAVKTGDDGARIPVVHQAASGGSGPGGDLESSVPAALDLGDGTVLANMGRFVFRLRKTACPPWGPLRRCGSWMPPRSGALSTGPEPSTMPSPP